MRIKYQFFGFILAFLSLAACAELLSDPPKPEETLAEPIEGLSPTQLQTHLAGDAEFARQFGETEGLGPIFVSTSCAACHAGDGKGHPVMNLTRFGRMTPTGFDPLTALGGGQLQHRAIAGYEPEQVPAEASGFSIFTAPAVTGLGYLEAVPDATLLALQDSSDANGDGISGRINWVPAPDFISLDASHATLGGKYIGRFGKKAGAINLLHQTANAYLQDMGITSDYLLNDLFAVQAGGPAFDAVADPEVASAVVNNVVFYMQTLKAPTRRNENEGTVIAGETLFMQIGCGNCHLPTLTTGAHAIDALSQVTFHPYTDLLLHDMGAVLDDGYTEGSAHTAEWRTAPLWGIGLAEASQGGAAYYLHDGRARTLEAAILLHGGEAQPARDAYESLSNTEKENLIAFLKSL